MDDRFQVIDENVKRELETYSTPDLVHLLFPAHPVRYRGLMRSPFREDRHPSFSCFRGAGGTAMWKDLATGEAGDNIALFRRVFPELSFVEAVDRMSMLVLGRTALKNYAGAVRSTLRAAQVRKAPVSRMFEPEKESKLKVVSEMPIDDARVPQELRDYWRGRGISDAVMKSMGCSFVVFENTNRKGEVLVDPVSGLPIVDNAGNPLHDDGLNEAIGIRNDIGGYVFRVPDSETHRGFKGATSSFVTTILADGSRPFPPVSLCGEGSYAVEYLRYDGRTGYLWINGTQYFNCVTMAAMPYAYPFLQEFVGNGLDGRDVKCLCAVLASLNAPSVSESVIVEGMFDGLSERELNRVRTGYAMGRDLIILNSVGNLKWATPFVARHPRATLLLDNDMESGAGQKAALQLRRNVEAFNRLVGGSTVITDGSFLFKGYKDLNEALMAGKGFPVKRSAEEKNAPANVKMHI